jgi:pimeloyl-ACP methyl ester carboxylesterase
MRSNPLGFLKAGFKFNLCEVVKTPEHYHRMFFFDDFPRDQVEQYYTRLNGESYRAFWDMLGLNLVHPKRIKAPMMVLGSRADRIITVNQVKHTARTYGVEPIFVDHMGHNLMLETGWQQGADHIIKWLEQNGI